MNIFVSIVSHGHQETIEEAGLLASLDGLDVAVRENKSEECRRIVAQVQYFQNLRRNGFGTNHNKTFEAVDLADEDWFVICNPDILTNTRQIRELVNRAEAEGYAIAIPYLFNEQTQQFDHNVRRWPTVLSLVQAFLKLGGNSRYTEAELRNICHPDWASGALMAIKVGTFRALSGFDEGYFMYMEDVDLCRRAARMGVKVRFYGDITMVHNAARASNSFFSASFVHHLTSVARYFLMHRGS